MVITDVLKEDTQNQLLSSWSMRLMVHAFVNGVLEACILEHVLEACLC